MQQSRASDQADRLLLLKALLKSLELDASAIQLELIAFSQALISLKESRWLLLIEQLGHIERPLSSCKKQNKKAGLLLNRPLAITSFRLCD